MSMKSITNKLDNLGSSPRSSEGIYNTATDKASSLFSSNKPSASRLLSVPESLNSSLSSVISDKPAPTDTSISFWRYFFVFLILSFLAFHLILFLIKPVNLSITHLYDPITDFFNKQFKGKTVSKTVSQKNNNAAVKKLDKLLTVKPVINNIDNTENKKIKLENKPEEIKKKYKKLPVIPQADDSTSSVQMKPASKSGFCYIGEDRGFRSCLEVGEGDVCMSGNIFPTESICINPNLRE